MKTCPACAARNEERAQFCHDCGGRLPAHSGGDSAPPGGGAELLPGERTGAADPLSSSMYGSLPPTAAPAAPGVETPAVPLAVTTCGNCRYRIPAGQEVSWCPGCGQLFDVPVTGAVPGDPVAHSAPPAVTPSAPVAAPASRTMEVGTAPAAYPPGWSLVLLRAGERLDRFGLRKGEVVIGRTEGDITFQDDPLLSPRHARLYARGRSFWLEDAGSRNGTYLRLGAPAELRHGDVVTFGGLVLRFESDGTGPISTSLITTEAGVKLFGSGREKARGRLVRILQDGSDGPAYPLTPSRTIVGRKLGHFLFPEDPLLSRQHAQFYERDGEMWVEDLGSSNGTMLQLRAPAELSKGTVFRVGDVTLEVLAP